MWNACQNNTIKNQFYCQSQLFTKHQVSWTAGKISVDRHSRGCNQAHSRQSHGVNNNDPVIIEQAVSGRPSETHRLSTHYITSLPANTDPNNQHCASLLIIATNHNATWLSTVRFMILMTRVRLVYKNTGTYFCFAWESVKLLPQTFKSSKQKRYAVLFMQSYQFHPLPVADLISCWLSLHDKWCNRSISEI